MQKHCATQVQYLYCLFKFMQYSTQLLLLLAVLYRTAPFLLLV
uniref:Uncharacterized protein n=1 Tax=Siphoviridae sp. ctXZx16 TaxID=2826371 RepID=A0A8S5MKU5_9CAUD|nr:MAG TPA: hypothetical protein [Siphoviridae sp. ctXZx16]